MQYVKTNFGGVAANNSEHFLKKPRKLPKGRLPPPPKNFSSWVEYAVINTHLGTIYNDSICGLYPWKVTREELDQALLHDYFALCESAGIEISEESRKQLERRFF